MLEEEAKHREDLMLKALVANFELTQRILARDGSIDEYNEKLISQAAAAVRELLGIDERKGGVWAVLSESGHLNSIHETWDSAQKRVQQLETYTTTRGWHVTRFYIVNEGNGNG